MELNELKLRAIMMTNKAKYFYLAIRIFFNTISKKWLMKFLADYERHEDYYILVKAAVLSEHLSFEEKILLLEKITYFQVCEELIRSNTLTGEEIILMLQRRVTLKAGTTSLHALLQEAAKADNISAENVLQLIDIFPDAKDSILQVSAEKIIKFIEY